MKDIRFCCKNVAMWNGGKGWWTEQVGGCQDTVMLLFQAYLWLYTVRCLTRSLSYKNLPSKQMVWYCISLQNPRGRPCDLAVEASQMLSKDDKTGRTVLQKQPLHSFALESQIDAPELLLCKRKTCYLLSSGACWLWLACHAYVGPGFDAVLDQYTNWRQWSTYTDVNRWGKVGCEHGWGVEENVVDLCLQNFIGILYFAYFLAKESRLSLSLDYLPPAGRVGATATEAQHGKMKKNHQLQTKGNNIFFVFPTFWTVNYFTCVTILFRIYL